MAGPRRCSGEGPERRGLALDRDPRPDQRRRTAGRLRHDRRLHDARQGRPIADGAVFVPAHGYLTLSLSRRLASRLDWCRGFTQRGRRRRSGSGFKERVNSCVSNSLTYRGTQEDRFCCSAARRPEGATAWAISDGTCRPAAQTYSSRSGVAEPSAEDPRGSNGNQQCRRFASSASTNCRRFLH